MVESVFCPISQTNNVLMSSLSRIHSVFSFLLLIFLLLALLPFATPQAASKDEVRLVPQTGHPNIVNAVAWSPDGKRVISGSTDDNKLLIWNASSGQILRILQVHQPSSVAWSPDGKHVVSGSLDNTLRIWDTANGQTLQILKGHTDWIKSVAWSPNGKLVASGSIDNTLRIWDASSGQIRHTLQGNANSVAWSPDGRHIAFGGGGNLKIWDVVSGQILKTLQEDKYGVHSIAWSPDGKSLVVSNGSTLQIWDVENEQMLRTLGGRAHSVHSVAWSPDSKRVVAGGYGNTLHIWDVASGKILLTLQGHTSVVWSVAWSPDGKYIVSGSSDRTLRIWDATSGQMLRTLQGDVQSVYSIAWSPNGKHLASGSSDNTLRIWDATSGQTLHTLQGHSSSVYSVAWSPDGKRMVSGSDDKTLRIWDAASGQTLHTLQGHSSYIRSVAWSPDGKRMVSGSADKTLRIWDAASGETVRTLKGHSSYVLSVAWSPDSKRVVSGSTDKTLRIWDAASGQTLHTLQGHSGSVLSVAWSPDGKRVLSRSFDNTLRIWDAASGQTLHTLQGHSSYIRSVAWSPDGKRVVSGSSDNTLRIWDVASGQTLHTLQGHSNQVDSVAWSPDGKRVVSGSHDDTIKFWNANSGKLLTTRINFDDGEWIDFTPDHYYRTSPNGEKYVTFRVGNQIYSVDQYAAIYKRPDIVAAALADKDTRTMIAQVERETGTVGLNISDLPPPEVFIRYWKGQNGIFDPDDPNSYTVGEKHLTLVAQAKESRFGVERVEVLINGQLFQTVSGQGKRAVSFQIPIALSDTAEQNQIELVAHSVKKVKSMREKLILSYDEAIQKGMSMPELARFIFGGERSWAVVIGIEKYPQGSGYDPLPYAVNDAQAVKQYLVNHLGFRNDRIISLYNHEATKSRILKLMGDELPQKISEEDRIIFFFSGHGATRATPSGKKFGYLLPVNANKKSMHSSSLSMNELHTFSELIPARQMLFVVDACYSGIAGTTYKKGDGIQQQTRSQVELFIKGGGRQIMTAGTADQVAWMSDKWENHSVYTYFFLKGLQGEADYNRDQVITTLELENWLETEVPKATQNKQHPQLYKPGLGEGQFVFYREGDLN